MKQLRLAKGGDRIGRTSLKSMLRLLLVLTHSRVRSDFTGVWQETGSPELAAYVMFLLCI